MAATDRSRNHRPPRGRGRPPALLAGAVATAWILAAGAAPASAAPMRTAAPATSSPTLAATFAAIDQDVRTRMNDTHLPGASLAIVKGDQLVHVAAFGDADDAGRTVTARTPFYIGSNSKSFTALAVMQLVEAGRVSLDAPVQRYLPWFRVADPVASAQITIRQLLNQTSGLPDWENYFWKTDSSPTALLDAVHSMSSMRPVHPVGTTFEYSSANFTILGLVVQIVAHDSYEHFVQTHILAPLNMTNTFLDVPTARAHGLATEHRYWFDRPFAGGGMPFNRAVTPAGLIISDATDMAHYVIAQLNGGRYDSTRILSAAGTAELHRGAAAIGGMDSYAMGWVSSIGIDGDRFAWHGGDTGGSHAYMSILPATGWGIVLLTNGSNDLRPNGQDAIAQGVLARLLGHQPAPPAGLLEQPYTIPLAVLLAGGLLQLAGVLRSVTLWRRWLRRPEQRPGGRFDLSARVAAPLLLNLAWAALCLLGVPALAGQPPRALVQPLSDLGMTALALGGLALIWGTVLRPLATAAVLLRTRPQASRVADQPGTGETSTGVNADGMKAIGSPASSGLQLAAADHGLHRRDAP
jgi:CubicO group peptidase (beta-lactamase class C family)